MSITVAGMSLCIERLWKVLPNSPYFDSLQSLCTTVMLMLFGGTIAFLMVWTEFTVIAETSALTFMVAGTFKEIVTGALLRCIMSGSAALCSLSEG
jgi:solute carrier family 35 protein C2